MDLLSLAYTSWASPGFRPDELDEIMRQSHTNNPLDGITGLLAFNGAAFLQIIEGAETAVLDLEERLQRDPRHCSLVVRDRRTVDKRAFPGWSMGLMRITSGRFEGQSELMKALERDTAPPVRELILAMMRSIPFDEPMSEAG
ncbi:BLUF domain-containing protein [Sphingomonas ginkgonis]|uniref:BLUF domain-containing protein n=1 Tax=Sphingomonas ginkgonis TaxID=2315330 RepID=A0A429VAP7_9SPHN|nr:BLUF domain-containing protein [Sphingomonas ginkgonis]RST31028.1 BLUF domain-containing protein [Sphingomonas ginkgonis]